MVERVAVRQSRKYNMVRLYLDDLDEIEAALDHLPEHENPYLPNRASNGKWLGGTVAELVAKGDLGPFSDFTLERHTKRGRVALTVRSTSTELTISDYDDLELRDAYHAIDKILARSRRGRLARFFISGWGTVPIGVCAMWSLPFFLVTLVIKPGDWELLTATGAASVVTITALVIAWRIDMHRNGLVYFTNRADNASLLQRKGDEIAIGLMLTVITLLGTYIIALATGH